MTPSPLGAPTSVPGGVELPHLFALVDEDVFVGLVDRHPVGRVFVEPS